MNLDKCMLTIGCALGIIATPLAMQWLAFNGPWWIQAAWREHDGINGICGLTGMMIVMALVIAIGAIQTSD